MDRTSASVGILFDIMFENRSASPAWQFESDWSPRIARSTLSKMERDGHIEIKKDDPRDWAVRQTAAGQAAALAADAA